MTTFTEQTGEGWVRSVNKRLAQLERLPRAGIVMTDTGATGTLTASSLSADTSVAFEADVLMVGGETSDPSVGTYVGDLLVGESEDGTSVDPFLIEDYDDYPASEFTPLSSAPVTPSDPVIEQRTGGVAVIWDGSGAGGTAIPVNMLMVEVHRSTNEFFDPDEATYCGSFLDAGVIVFADQEYEVQWWYRFLLLTTDGTRSTPTNPVEGTAHKISQFEVGFSASEIDFDGAIESAKNAAINAAARTNYSTNPSLLNHSGAVLAEWVGMEWFAGGIDGVVDGGSAGTSTYPATIDGGTASSTFDSTLDGGSA